MHPEKGRKFANFTKFTAWGYTGRGRFGDFGDLIGVPSGGEGWVLIILSIYLN